MRRLWVVVVLATIASSSAVHADSATPWADGVSETQKATAQRLLEAGNALFLDKKYVEALEQYEAAVATWDHPAIRFNMVRCLVLLGRNLEAADNLERSLKYGAAPLEETVYNEALGYQKLLSTQIGDVAVSCNQDGVQLTLDGKSLGTCPVTEKRRVLAGQHQIVGIKDGLLPKTVEIVVIGGEGKAVDINLVPVEKGATIVHRWPTYVPYAVGGGGLLLVGAGTLISLVASGQMENYDQLVDANCASNCPPEQAAMLAETKSSAELKSAIGTSVIIAGAATVAAGAVMIYLNRGRTVYPSLEVHGDGAAVSLGGHF